MADQPNNTARWVSSVAVLVLLLVTGIASAIIWWTGDWKQHAWGLTLTLRILWGVWIVLALATILTRVTIFGWSFRRYFRRAGDKMPEWARFRPSRAPWSKSGKASFSFTVVNVALFGLCAVATAVMWILVDVTGEWVFWLVFKIIWSSWWVLQITLVLVRVAVFAEQRQRELREQNNKEPSLVGGDPSESNE
jgi:hypothetical protein